MARSLQFSASNNSGATVGEDPGAPRARYAGIKCCFGEAHAMYRDKGDGDMKRYHAWMTCALATATIAACSGDGSDGSDGEPLADTSAALTASPQAGHHLFDNPLPQTNGRACATCHPESENTTLH